MASELLFASKRNRTFALMSGSAKNHLAWHLRLPWEIDFHTHQVLLKGYQAENEGAVARLKTLQAEAKEKEALMASENARLGAELAGVRNDKLSANADGAKQLQSNLRREAEMQAERDGAAAREEASRLPAQQ